MERLSLSSVPYDAPEAAIHMARYQLAVPHCKGRRVLDIACGEGYGAYFLHRLGATSVEAVDISRAAIEVAKARFAGPGLNYYAHDAELVDQLFDPLSFDLIVCLETIEHLRYPRRFLEAIRIVAKKDCVIIISCPNDQWYYRGNDVGNPYHISRYSFGDFRGLTTEVLGTNVVWGFGVPMMGFGSISVDDAALGIKGTDQAAMLACTQQASAIVLPPASGSNVGSDTCSYFLGVWGGGAHEISSGASFPLSMDDYSLIAACKELAISPSKFAELQGRESVLTSELSAARERVHELEMKQAGDFAVIGRLERDLALASEHMRALDSRASDAERAASELATQHSRDFEIVQRLEHELNLAREHICMLESRATAAERAATEAANVKCLDETKIAEAGVIRHNLEREISALRTESDRYRLQAVALLKETELLCEHNTALKASIDERDAAILQQTGMIDAKNAEIQQQIALIQARDAVIRQQTTMIDDRDAAIRSQTAMIDDRDTAIRDQTMLIDQRDLIIDKLNTIAGCARRAIMIAGRKTKAYLSRIAA